MKNSGLWEQCIGKRLLPENGAASAKHTAAFPIEIPRRLIKMYSFVEDTVLDLFLGSATTTKAAMELGRNSIKKKLALDETQPLQGLAKAQFEFFYY